VGLIDWSKYRSDPVSMGPGLDLFGATLDGIMKRRHEKQLRQQQEAADIERARMAAEVDRERIGETGRHNLHTEQNADANTKREDMRFEAALRGQAGPQMDKGNDSAAAPLLEMAGNMAERRAPPAAPVGPDDALPMSPAAQLSPLEDARAAREADARQRGERASALLAPHATDDIGKAALGLSVAHAQGSDPSKTVEFFNANVQAEKNRRAAASRAREAGNRPPKPATPGQVTDDARADMNAYLANTGYKIDQGSMRSFGRMEGLAAEAAKGNPMASRAFMGMWAKFAQGEVGVLNQSDLDTFWNNAGSPVERTEEALAKLVSGGLGDGKRENAVAAIKALTGTIKSRLDQTYAGAVDMMRPHGATGERYLKAFFGRGLPESEGQAGDKREQIKDLIRKNPALLNALTGGTK
jgi:hypothetical protein